MRRYAKEIKKIIAEVADYEELIVALEDFMRLEFQAFQKEILHKAPVKEMGKPGYERVTESGGKLWELHRGWRWQYVITDSKVDPDGKSVWVKCELPEGTPLKAPPV